MTSTFKIPIDKIGEKNSDDYIHSIIYKKMLYKLYLKYTSEEYDQNQIQINYLVFNEKCRVVAIFKDYLVLDDTTEFLRRFYNRKESAKKLNVIFNFYSTYSKIFPNYMILPESEYLYKNIRKKQKMIDAFNEIKKEEEENKKRLEIGININKDKIQVKNIVFSKEIEESINKYQPSCSISIYQNFDKKDNDDSITSISMMSLASRRGMVQNIGINPNGRSILNQSFEDTLNDDSLTSIALIVNVMKNKGSNNNNSNNAFPPFYDFCDKMQTPRKQKKELNNKDNYIGLEKENQNITYQRPRNNSKPIYTMKNLRKNFFPCPKSEIENKDANQNSLQYENNRYIEQDGNILSKKLRPFNSNIIKNQKIINNVQNILIPEGANTVININTNYFNYNNSHNQNFINKSKSRDKEKSKKIEKEKQKEKSKVKLNIGIGVSVGSKTNTKCPDNLISTSIKKTIKTVSKQLFRTSQKEFVKQTKKKLEFSNKKEETVGSKFTNYKSPEKDSALTLNSTLTHKISKINTTAGGNGKHFINFFPKKDISKPQIPSTIQKTTKSNKKMEISKQKVPSQSKNGIKIDFLHENEIKISKDEKTNKENQNINDKNSSSKVNTKLQCTHSKLKSDIDKNTKKKYKNFIEGAKIQGYRISYDLNDNIHENLNTEGNANISSNIINNYNSSRDNNLLIHSGINKKQKEKENYHIKTPSNKCRVASPNIGFFPKNKKVLMTAKPIKIKLDQKDFIPKNNESFDPKKNKKGASSQEKSKILNSLNFKVTDNNTKKMKFVKK